MKHKNILCSIDYPVQVIQTLDSTTHRTNHHPADKYYGKQLRYPLGRNLSGGYSTSHLLKNWGPLYKHKTVTGRILLTFNQHQPLENCNYQAENQTSSQHLLKCTDKKLFPRTKVLFVETEG